MPTIQSPLPPQAAELVERFAQELRDNDMSASTVNGYRRDVELFLRWLYAIEGEEADVRRVTTTIIAAYRHALLHRQRLKATTVNRRLLALRRFFRWTTRRGKTRANPSTEVKTVRIQKRLQPRGLRRSQVQALLRAAGLSKRHGKRNYALVQLLLQTGVRTCELVDLLVGDVTLRARSGELLIRNGKGMKQRAIPLNAAARRGLADYLAIRREPAADEPLFLTERGSGMVERTARATLASIAARARIEEPVGPHTLRHTFALNYLEAHPGQLVELATLMGHESLDTTAVYTRPSAEALTMGVEASALNVL
jgi:integrase/recombinase XerC